MKKALAIVMSTILALSLFGCGKSGPTEGKLGDTLKTDVVEITLTGFGFAEEGVSIDEEQPDIFCTAIPFPYELSGNDQYDALILQLSGSKYVRKTTEKCVVYLEYTVKYSGEEVETKGICMPHILFDGTEKYHLNAVTALQMSDYFVDQPDGAYYRQTSYGWESFNLLWSGNSEDLYRGVARIPIAVEENVSAPLTVYFNALNSKGETVQLTFTIR